MPEIHYEGADAPIPDNPKAILVKVFQSELEMGASASGKSCTDAPMFISMLQMDVDSFVDDMIKKSAGACVIYIFGYDLTKIPTIKPKI
ncbi:hypothetical protein [Novosphingobium aquimarinum]|uniref:hypothetical protein n=1 Tax=Novosphingobium aquimarinum TaxID=2682494 RepID=UPI0012EBD388|nr:hypothetical protein [Novosphingobium aquimarinum]